MAHHYIQTVCTNSLEKIFPELEPKAYTKPLSALNNEPLSFQIAYKLVSTQSVATTTFVKITSALPISLYSVGYVPALQALDPNLDDKYRSGLFGDVLLPKKVNPKTDIKRYPWTSIHVEDDPTHLSARTDTWQSLWLTVNESQKRIKSGVYPIKVQFFSGVSGVMLGECETSVEIIGASLYKQTLKFTNWFHVDCLCDTYKIEPYSDRFWEIFISYIEKATLNGMNTLLTPCFTPPLDTPVDGERKTVQLVGVSVDNGVYSFDFSLLDKYISVAQKCGIKYFEHSHLFTQWGAKHAPKIMATVNGKYKRIFGWETTSHGKKYSAFLHAYIPALLDFLKAKNLDKNFIFHISDEPAPEHKEGYKKAKKALGKLLDNYTVGDALSHYELYQDGTVTTPIVCTDHIHEFYGKTKGMWAYYTGGQCFKGLSNRKINCSGERNRMLGTQLYMHEIQGFLHWGYNYWYDALSQGLANPNTDACFYNAANPGTSYLVYPALDGSCLQSIRQKICFESVNDMRALQRLESMIGKRETKKFVQDFFGEVTFFTHPQSAERFLQFRALLNKKIQSLLK